MFVLITHAPCQPPLALLLLLLLLVLLLLAAILQPRPRRKVQIASLTNKFQVS